MILHCGGKMEDTRTRFCDAMPASRRASSNEVNRSLCLPTPLVKNIFFGTMLFPNFYVPSVNPKNRLPRAVFPHEFIASWRALRQCFGNSSNLDIEPQQGRVWGAAGPWGISIHW